MAVEQAGSPPPPRPHLLSSAQPNKPSLFRVTFNVVPTESHTSPNPAKICTKLNQSILEMALVSFCQRTVCRGWRDQEGPSGREDWGDVGALTSRNLQGGGSIWWSGRKGIGEYCSRTGGGRPGSHEQWSASYLLPESILEPFMQTPQSLSAHCILGKLKAEEDQPSRTQTWESQEKRFSKSSAGTTRRNHFHRPHRQAAVWPGPASGL